METLPPARPLEDSAGNLWRRRFERRFSRLKISLNSFTHHTKPTRIAKFNVLPPEIREQCFIPCLEWNGKTPELIVAARGNEKIYGEVMDIFYRMGNTYVLHQGNSWSFNGMSERAMASIKKVKLVGEQFDQSIMGGLWLAITLRMNWPAKIRPEFHLPNVTSIHIACESFVPSPSSPLQHLGPDSRRPGRHMTRIQTSDFWAFMLWFPSLRTVKFGMPVGVNHSTFKKAISDMVEKGNSVLGVAGRLTTVGDFSGAHWYLPDEWIWEAGSEDFAWNFASKYVRSSETTLLQAIENRN